ncbi:MAG: DUF2182 domain-containing protein [Solirubrobacterales bacterium]|nr:DUF2182 domain-containing protein [Solirubrobacterales bacterium]
MEHRPTAVARSASAFLTGQGSGFGRAGGQARLVGALLALAALAWAATGLRMAGMDAGPGTNPGALGFFISTWVVMTAAMMLPAVAPMVLAYRDLQHERRGHRAGAHTGEAGRLPRRLGCGRTPGLCAARGRVSAGAAHLRDRAELPFRARGHPPGASRRPGPRRHAGRLLAAAAADGRLCDR